MFCTNCGKEIDDNAVVCPYCGVATKNMAAASAPAVGSQKNTLALVGFILSFFSSLIGLILSIIGFQRSKLPEYNGDGRSFAIAGIVLSCISTGLYILIYAVIIGGTCAAAGAM